MLIPLQTLQYLFHEHSRHRQNPARIHRGNLVIYAQKNIVPVENRLDWLNDQRLWVEGWEFPMNNKWVQVDKEGDAFSREMRMKNTPFIYTGTFTVWFTTFEVNIETEVHLIPDGR